MSPRGGDSYNPYGEARASATTLAVVSNVVRYIGGHQDSANLYKLGARYYDATQGRFTQMDPSGQEKNPYGYSSSNPISFVDPYGLDLEEAVETASDQAAVGAVGGCVGGAVVGAIGGPAAGPACVAGVISGFVAGTVTGFMTYAQGEGEE